MSGSTLKVGDFCYGDPLAQQGVNFREKMK
jgi:hypothetical protein